MSHVEELCEQPGQQNDIRKANYDFPRHITY